MENQIVKEEKPVIKGELSEEEVQKLVNKNPKCSIAVFMNGNDEPCCVYLKRIDREIFVQANKFLDTKDELTACEYLLTNILIGGMTKDEILADFEAFKNCTATIMNLLTVKKGFIAELKKN